MKEERKEGTHMNGYAVKPNMPFVTCKTLKETRPSCDNINMVKLMDTHNFSLREKDGKFVMGATKKNGV